MMQYCTVSNMAAEEGRFPSDSISRPGEKGFKFAIDRGGTFTDIYAETPDGRPVVMKLLSEDPANYPDAPREGIRRIIEKELGKPLPPNEPIDSGLISWIRMGTTLATNALLERKGERIALLITEGFKDLLHIGNQSRPRIFDLTVTCPETLYEKVVEVKERVVLSSEKCRLDWSDKRTVSGVNGDSLHVLEELDLEKLKKDLRELLNDGITTVAVVLMHSYLYPDHEWGVAAVAMEMGFKQVSLSSDVMSMVRIVPRGFTACADGYLTPVIKQYVKSFSQGFTDPDHLSVLFMQSDGGLTPMNKFVGSHAILSGPAGGVVGFAMTTYHHDTHKPVIGFDMGDPFWQPFCNPPEVKKWQEESGTSTDVSRYDGEYEHVFETTTGGVSIQAPQLDINTVAAGGGSRLLFRSGLFVVGPESAGAHPGPTCYGKGGPLAITDANLVLGRLIPEYFPKIFGPSEDQPLNMQASILAFDALTAEVNEFLLEQGNKPLTCHQVAMGFIQVANESMCRPIRSITQSDLTYPHTSVLDESADQVRELDTWGSSSADLSLSKLLQKGKGYDTAHHVLACFGGAGGQHACAIARLLGMKTVFIHRYSGILSAYGLALADVVHEEQEPCSKVYNSENFGYFDKRIESLSAKCYETLQQQGYTKDCISVKPFLYMRYDKTDCALMCLPHPNPSSDKEMCRNGDFETAFLDRYMREFGFTIPSRDIIVDDIRIRAVAKVMVHKQVPIAKGELPAKAETEVQCYFEEGLLGTKVYLLDNLMFGHSVEGPSIIMDKNSTILVEPRCVATITEYGDVRIEVDPAGGVVEVDGTILDTIQLSIFSHRFMSIAEQMGRILQRTSISTNIKERLDFSCALFGPDGGLVANAPHIPVHLGAMQEAVQYQMQALGDDIHEGDVIASNHPAAGGCHLPDITVITPVFYPGHPKPMFYVANRGHHADIGGITPGSMPPNSRYLWEEGMQVKTFKLVTKGIFQEEGMTQLLMEPAKYPGCSGTRNLHDNISDLRAQVAANLKGINLVKELISFYGMSVTMAYMNYIQENAEVCVRDMLREISKKAEKTGNEVVLSAEDHLDDSSPLKLKVTIEEDKGSAVFDFTGTGPQVPLNLNAPKSITRSAVLYCLRCMVGHDVPLNQGCLKPITFIIPEGSFLDPSDEAAVIGGNVLTSQRLTDVVFKAFKVCAASQGCMNNTTFGNESFGYYETVAGGAGAGPTWHGRSGVHTHMTNTRITDPEILERRYPVILNKFHLNKGTGGRGLFQGGDGVLREMMFRTQLTLSVLSERRVYRPYGLEGGEPGALGRNTLIRKDNSVQDIGGKATVSVYPGDVFRLETPGGGGYGDKNVTDSGTPTATPPLKKKKLTK